MSSAPVASCWIADTVPNPGRAPEARDHQLPDAFLEAVIQGDSTAAVWCCRAWGSTAAQRLDDVFQGLAVPAISRLEALWQEDQIALGRLGMAFLTVQRVLRQVLEDRLASRPPPQKGHVCLARVDGAEHAFGPLMAADAFSADGWSFSLHAPDAWDGVIAELRQIPTALLGISLGNDRELARVPSLAAQARSQSRNPALKVIVGGPILSAPRDQYAFLRADFVALSCWEAITYANLVCSAASRQAGDLS
jgi:MerR family transcriptional regulator, light-induced transcriptional regulator